MISLDQIEGVYFPPLSSRSEAAYLTVRAGQPSLSGPQGSDHLNLEIDSFTEPDTIHFQNGSSFKASAPLPLELLASNQTTLSRTLSWFETFSWPKLLVLCVIFIACIGLFRLAIYGTTGLVTNIFPEEWERQIGETYYAGLEKAALAPSTIDESRQKTLIEAAKQMAVNANFEQPPEIIFHASKVLGANALAFPGGPIVVTDGLVNLLKDNDEILAVIAHELGHVRERHSLQQTIDLLGTALLISFVFGSDDSLMEEIAGVGLNTWAFSKSRNFEREADLAAIEMLSASGRNPTSFVDAMEKLTLYQCSVTAAESAVRECVSNNDSGWWSTHPSGSERIDNLKRKIQGIND